MAALGLLVFGGGVILLYAGFRGVSVVDTFRNVLEGKPPPASATSQTPTSGPGVTTPSPNVGGTGYTPIPGVTLPPTGGATINEPGRGLVNPAPSPGWGAAP